ncbi:MAG: hypothetical protein K0Q77_207 [Anaerosporomusa subterranea]|jgi:hypothetical protein|nr:hypothetical protein [Anaerosporomusa subterranea]
MAFRRTVLIKLLLFLIMFAGFAISQPQLAAAEPVRVAVVPYINSSGENRSVVDATIASKLEGYFQSGNYVMVPPGEVADFLAKSGYDATPMLLPEKDVLLALARATGADAVLAMDFARIQANRRYSWFYSYTIGSVSIYAKALSVSDNNFISLRIEKQEKLRASRFGPGVKERVAIGAGIEAAMDDMFTKLPF